MKFHFKYNDLIWNFCFNKFNMCIEISKKLTVVFSFKIK